MKKLPQSKRFFLVCAVFFTAVCLMYGAVALTKGLYAALAVPSPVANIAFFSASFTLAVLCWVRWLRGRADREEFHQKKHSPAACWALAALCGAGALLCVLVYLLLERSAAALAAAGFLALCAAVWLRRGAKAQRKD